jgi:hydroxyacyl-ACP dehydratase HTD2-like protein with hotdog domain
MKAFRSSQGRTSIRRLGTHATSRWSSSTSSPTAYPPIDVGQIRARLTSPRPPDVPSPSDRQPQNSASRIHDDFLSRGHAQQLRALLADLLPAGFFSSSLPSSFPPGDAPADGDPLRPGEHLAFFPARHPASALAADGTDRDHHPGPPLARRMWAGGGISFRPGALRLGCPAYCVESVADVSLRGTGTGRDDKVFVELRREYRQAVRDDAKQPADGPEKEARRSGDDSGGVLCAEERRTLVFMRPSEGEAPPRRVVKGE